MLIAKYDRRKAARKIREWQSEHRLKGYEIAKDARISAPYYCDISRGKQRGSIEVLSRIAAVFGKTVNDLFEEKDADTSKELKIKELRKAVTPVLGRKDASDFVKAFELWSGSPDQFKRALEVYHR